MPIGCIFRTVYFCAFSYLIAGLSTTDVLRLTKDQRRSVLTHDSYCDNCGYNIPLSNQLPIVSHLINKGRCKNCNAPIPIIQFTMECVLFASLLLIGILTGFQESAFVIGLLFYELLKIVVILYRGRRKQGFLVQLSHSLLMNLVMFGFGYVFFFVISLFQV